MKFILVFLALNAIIGHLSAQGASCNMNALKTGQCYPDALSFYAETISGSTIHIQSNCIPQSLYMHSIQKPNPNTPCEQKVDWTFTQSTTKPSAFLDTAGGPIGLTRDGKIIFNHLAVFDGSGLNDVANHVDGEATTLDACYGHGGNTNPYHLHALAKVDSCSKDGSYNDCELVGWMVDGRRFYSYCQNAAKSRYLKSCYVLTGTGGESTSDYTFTSSSSCDLDEANGYDFTGKGLTDNNGAAITGYAYVATDTYPWTQPKLGSDFNCDVFKVGTFDTTASSGACTPGSCSSTSNVQNTPTLGGNLFQCAFIFIISSFLVLLQ